MVIPLVDGDGELHVLLTVDQGTMGGCNSSPQCSNFEANVKGLAEQMLRCTFDQMCYFERGSSTDQKDSAGQLFVTYVKSVDV